MRNILKACAIGFMLILPSLSFAAELSQKQTVSKIHANFDGTVRIWGANGDWLATNFCDSSAFILLKSTVGTGSAKNEAYSEMYALIVASYLQGKSIDGWLNGCYSINSITYPILQNVNSYLE